MLSECIFTVCWVYLYDLNDMCMNHVTDKSNNARPNRKNKEQNKRSDTTETNATLVVVLVCVCVCNINKNVCLPEIGGNYKQEIPMILN